MRDVSPERLELHLTTICTSRCTFCSEADRMRTWRRFPVDARAVRQVLREWVPRGVKHVHFTGGEPTLHRDLPALAALCHRSGLRTSIGTNGWRLADAAYAARLLPHLDDVMVSLHGPDADTHDGLTGRAGGFDRAVAALGHCAQPGVNIVVTRGTLHRVVDTARLAVSLGAAFVLVSAVSPEGDGAADYPALATPLSALPAVAEAVLGAVGDKLPVRFFGVPACALGAARYCSNDLYWSPRVAVERGGTPAAPTLDAILSVRPDRGRAQVQACRACAWAGVCPGPFARYVETFGSGEIVAIGGSERGTIPSHP